MYFANETIEVLSMLMNLEPKEAVCQRPPLPCMAQGGGQLYTKSTNRSYYSDGPHIFLYCHMGAYSSKAYCHRTREVIIMPTLQRPTAISKELLNVPTHHRPTAMSSTTLPLICVVATSCSHSPTPS
eukprot:2722975-Karenia_brevis.AAC.1